MASVHKIVGKTGLLQDIVEDSNRLSPLVLALFDDIESHQSMANFVGNLINLYTNNKNNPKHVTVLQMEGNRANRFFSDYQIQPNSNLTLITEQDLDHNIYSLNHSMFNEQVEKKLSSFNKSNQDNVLVINPVNVLYFIERDSDKNSKCNITNLICRWIVHLKFNTFFSHIIFVYHADDLANNTSKVLAFRNISNAIIDFRLESTGTSKLPKCSLGKINGSIHVHVSTKKKHPRTHMKEERKHEHFTFDSSFKYITEEQVDKILNKKEAVVSASGESSQMPQTTFNLTLKKDEQEAKDNLVLPYIKKNSQVSIQNKSSESSSANCSDTSKESQIIYNYDQYDDWDEDDPDDDLDF